MSEIGAINKGLAYLCCVGANDKSWAEGEDDGDAKYQSIQSPKNQDGIFGLGGAADKRICVPQKIDPKTFFANERTFLKWLSISVMVGMMSLTLLHFSDTNSDGAVLAGLVLLPVSLIFMVYSLYVFRMRASKIYMREPMRYDDTRGPTMLVVVLGVAISLATVFSLQRHYSRIDSASFSQGGNAAARM
ncbi:Hypothetical protein, putative [Bodo saltans]|uniref:DUF202 domain-containing protein n=1 Tax=Bodo saltans TaxID=75058 RepID=A0A0S4IYL4_BODSA|nr:Hypothetical protein, putative [Bodo saltans]|eukprot:CUG52588.1 Hypothetical protein, putative [Bodo saltans]